MAAGPFSRRGVLKTTASGVLVGGIPPVTRGTQAADAAQDSTVIVGSHDSNVYAVDAATGAVRWAFTTPAEFTYSSPIVVEGTVYIGNNDGNLYAIDAASGEQRWTFTNPTAWIWSSPSVEGGTVYFGSHDESLYAVDAETGDEQWTFSTSTAITSSPTVADDVVFVASYRTLYAIDADSADQRWAVDDVRFGSVSSPTVIDERLYVGDLDSTLYAIDADTGEAIWTFTEATAGYSYSSPTVVDGTVFIGSNDSTVYAVDGETGEREWAFTSPSSEVWSSPTVVDGTVFVGGLDPTVYAIDATSGQLRWAFTDPTDSVVSSPTVAHGMVFVGSNDGSVYAIAADTGERVWRFADPADSIISSPTVVADQADGSSIDSRVNLGTLGHHHGWAGQRPTEKRLDAAIISMDVPEGPVAPGDDVTAEVTVENTGTIAHTFFVGFSVIAPDNQVFDNDGTTGTPVSLSPGERETVSVTWVAEIEAPGGPYEAGSAIWEEGSIDDLETRVDERWIEDAFVLENEELPGWAFIHDPVTPDSWPYAHTSWIEIQHVPDRTELAGPGITTTVDRHPSDETGLTLTVDIELPDDSVVDHIEGVGHSQILVLFNDRDLTLIEDDVQARVDDATPRAVRVASFILSGASLATAGKGEMIRAAVEELAVQAAEEWVSSRFTIATTPSLEDAAPADISILHVDFSADWFPSGRDPSDFEAFSLKATFTAEAPIDPTEVSVFFDLRGETVRPEIDRSGVPPITAGIVESDPYPVELRGELVVPVDEHVLGSNDARTASQDDDSIPGFGTLAGIAGMSGAGYLLKRRFIDADESE